MADRDGTTNVQLKVRMKEPLRAALEKVAQERGVSLNAEIVYRLERSFDLEQRLKEAIDWNSEWYEVTRRLVDAFELALDEISGKPLKAFKEATRQVRQPPVPPWERNE
jgi:Arc-like DNA binding domain